MGRGIQCNGIKWEIMLHECSRVLLLQLLNAVVLFSCLVCVLECCVRPAAACVVPPASFGPSLAAGWAGRRWVGGWLPGWGWLAGWLARWVGGWVPCWMLPRMDDWPAGRLAGLVHTHAPLWDDAELRFSRDKPTVGNDKKEEKEEEFTLEHGRGDRSASRQMGEHGARRTRPQRRNGEVEREATRPESEGTWRRREGRG